MEYDDLNDRQKIQVAKGFDATPELVPFIPYLLQDLWSLGSFPHYIIEILKSLKLPQGSRVLDLACGKGAVSFKIAKELGFKVLGIDLFKPFIEIAQARAHESDAAKLCAFKVEDINAAVKIHRNFDVVILASAESLLGKIENVILSLRECIHHNGYIIFDSSYRVGDVRSADPEYSVIENYDDTLKSLTSQGDMVIHEIKVPPEEIKKMNDNYTQLIRQRSEELIIKYPGKKGSLLSYVKKQEDECKIIENELAGCLWCIQKY